jgi:hypothetical protein
MGHNVPEVPVTVLKIENCAVTVRSVGRVRSMAHLPYKIRTKYRRVEF